MPDAAQPSDSVAATVDRPPHRRAGFVQNLVRFLGVFLISCTILLVLAGPDVASRETYTAVHLLAISGIAAYGVLLALMQRNTQVSLERAYSSHLEELSQRLRNMAYRDAVTGLYNHRYFREQLAHEIERSLRYEQSFTIPQFLDVDKISASHKHGMLRLAIPLKESVKPRRIKIEGVADRKQIAA